MRAKGLHGRTSGGDLVACGLRMGRQANRNLPRRADADHVSGERTVLDRLRLRSHSRRPERRSAGILSPDTRFELDVDGERVSLVTDLETEGEIPVRKTDFVNFPSGLAAGWHEFAGRWYESGALILSSRSQIEFVEAA